LIHFTVPYDGVHAFGYKSIESEPIWMKSAAHCLGLALAPLADFGRDPRSQSRQRESQAKLFCHVSNARLHFPSAKNLRGEKTFFRRLANSVDTFSDTIP